MGKQGKQVEFSRIRGDSGQHRRILAAMAALGAAAFFPVAAKLWSLMVINFDFYSAQALRNQTRSTSVSASRGVIYDRNMNVLAQSVGVENIYLDPHELKQSDADIAALSRQLAQILDLDADWIGEQAADLTMRYKLIASAVPEETAALVRQYITDEEISGVHLEPSTERSYPYGTLAAQVIGFTNASNTGSEGVEAAYDSYLSGASGTVITTKGNNEMDMPYSYENYLTASPGCDVILTLDTTVQSMLEQQMQAEIERYQVQNGAFGVVMNVNTGEILAMATLSSYDPNDYQAIADPAALAELESLREKYLAYPSDSAEYAAGQDAYEEALAAARLKQWRNRVISDGYEPGSTFKLLTMSAALDSGAIDLNSTFYCSGSERIAGRSQLLHCWRSAGHGSETTAQALQNSCNIAFAHIALQLGGETFYEYIERFGILEKTGIDLYGESKGVFFDREIIVDTEKWGTASLTSASFGQTFKLTPMQLVRAVASVVNGGNLVEPYIVSEVIDASGNTVLKNEPTVVRQTISAETSAAMCELIRSVVTDGTAKNAAVAGYDIGGKTGTSEKIDVLDENGNPTLDKIVSFVGIAPMDDPEYIVLIALDTPSRETGIYISGGVMAAPTVGAVLADILPYLGVEQTLAADDPAATEQVMPDLTGLTAQEAEKLLSEYTLSASFIGAGETVVGQIPAAGERISGGSETVLYLSGEPGEVMAEVPDFAGMTRQQASDAAGVLGLYILVAGNTEVSPSVTVQCQDIAPGTSVRVGTTIQLTFADGSTSD